VRERERERERERGREREREKEKIICGSPRERSMGKLTIYSIFYGGHKKCPTSSHVKESGKSVLIKSLYGEGLRIRKDKGTQWAGKA
jgi:hypothetical protein